ncbi:MAG: hypothetical protein JKY62_10635 [Desulfocapsa sp.]|nr:hypothetical protein [Desulfocapsa sp.]MBN4045865.1 hypothetical protein [bacterium AH-315-P11]MBN4060071.1 hypothetical protein [Desulfotalea psychrophila]
MFLLVAILLYETRPHNSTPPLAAAGFTVRVRACDYGSSDLLPSSVLSWQGWYIDALKKSRLLRL